MTESREKRIDSEAHRNEALRSIERPQYVSVQMDTKEEAVKLVRLYWENRFGDLITEDRPLESHIGYSVDFTNAITVFGDRTTVHEIENDDYEVIGY